MSQLTKEYFEEVIKNLASKQDLDQQSKQLKIYINERITEETEALARIVAKGFDSQQEFLERYLENIDTRTQVKALESDVRKIKDALAMPSI